MKAVGGLLVSDLGKQLPGRSQDEVERAKNSLLQTGLAVSEVVVICRKSQAQIACVPGRETLEDVSRLSVICACGRAYLDERIEEALNVIDATRALLDSSRWLSLIVLDELLRLGITLDQIRIDQVRGGDELDAFVNVSGELVLFEFKDKEFSLGNAYSFVAKIGWVKPNHAVVLTTETVGNDVREHFHRSGFGSCGLVLQRWVLRPVTMKVTG